MIQLRFIRSVKPTRVGSVLSAGCHEWACAATPVPGYSHRVLAPQPKADQPPTHPLVLVGFVLLGFGVIAWAWTGTWQWGLSGLVLGIIAVGASTVRRS